MAQLIKEWVLSCEPCIGESGSDRNLIRPPLKNPNEHITASEEAMQIDLVLPSGGFDNIVTTMDVFSRSLFACLTSNQHSKTIAKVISNVKTNHAYLPTTLISDKGSDFVSDVITEVAGVLGCTLKHVNTKYAQILGLIE